MKKARRLGISQDSSLDEDEFEKQNGIELTPEEIKMIRA